MELSLTSLIWCAHADARGRTKVAGCLSGVPSDPGETQSSVFN
jgi:hypothetical protein